MLTVEQINQTSIPGSYPHVLGFEIVEAEPGFVRSRFEVGTQHIAATGAVFGGTLVSLADFTCGWGALLNLPEGAHQFLTLEVKLNFIGNARSGEVSCEAVLTHGGRTTQVWDATLKDAAPGKTIALFRCTQMVVYDYESKVGAVSRA